MSAVEHPTDTGASEATVAPILPLLLLESIRAHDRPREVLQNEDLASSLPRRLGLTGVVESRIRRYEEEQRRGRGVPLDDVLDLIRLVLRRPDAELILRQTGEELARRHFKRISAATVSALGFLPGTAGAAALRRAVRSMLRRATGASDLEVRGWPIQVRIRDSLTSQADPNGNACVLFAAALEKLLELYTRKRPQIVHTACNAWGDEACIWSWTE